MNVNCDGSWNVYVHNHPVKSDCQALNAIPPKMSCLDSLLNWLMFNVYAGHPDNKLVLFCEAKKGKFTSTDGKEVAFLDDYLPISLNGSYVMYWCAVLSMLRVRIIEELTIRLLCNRWHKRNSDSMSDSSCHTNHRFLTTPEKHHKLKKAC